MVRTPKLILFDLDGTLIEFHKTFLYNEAERLLREYELPQVSRALLDDAFCDFDFFRFVDAEHRPGFMEYFWNNFNFSKFPAPVPLPGALETLARLSDWGIAQFVVTARVDGEEKLRQELEPTGFLSYLDGIIGRPGEHVDWQDKKAMIHAACEAANTDPLEAAMVGDIPPDIISAKEAGVGLSIAVLSGTIRESVLAEAGPDFILPGVSALCSDLFEDPRVCVKTG